MTKADLVSSIKTAAGLSAAESGRFLNAFLEVVAAELASGEEVPLPGFGKFSVKSRAERTGRNPQTGAEIRIPACKAASFTAAKALREALNK